MALVQRNVQLDQENVDWFERTYPKSSLSAMLNMLLEKYRGVTTMTPADYAELAIKELREELE